MLEQSVGDNEDNVQELVYRAQQLEKESSYLTDKVDDFLSSCRKWKCLFVYILLLQSLMCRFLLFF